MFFLRQELLKILCEFMFILCRGYCSVASQNESLPQLASIFKFDEDYISGCYEKKVVNFMYEESYDEAELSDSDF